MPARKRAAGAAKIKTSAGSKVFDAFNYVFLTLFTLTTLYPFYYIFIYSISDPIEAQKGIVLWPAGFTLDNYVETLKISGILDAAFISLARTVLGTALTVFCCTFLAYLVTKEKLRFRKFIYRFVVITMYLNAGIIPWYMVMRAYGLNNNFLLYIIPSAVSAYFVILIKTYLESIPPSLEESAELDGAGYWKRFWRIIWPMATPIIATIVVFSAVNQWNTWYDNLFLVQDKGLRTLQLVLYDYLNEANRMAMKSIEELSRGQSVPRLTPTSVRMTITMVVTLPIIVVYPFMQRYFVKGLMLGAVKG